MKVAVKWGNTLIWLIVLAAILFGCPEAGYAQVLKDSGDASSSLTAVSNMTSLQSSLGVMAGGFPSLFGSDFSLTLPFAPIFPPLTSASVIGDNSISISAMLSQSTGGISAGGGGPAAYQLNPIGNSGSINSGLAMPFWPGIFPGVGGSVLSNLALPIQPTLNFPPNQAIPPNQAALPFPPNQGRTISSVFPPALIGLNPFGPQKSPLQTGGYSYNSSSPYNPAMMSSDVMQGVGPWPGGGGYPSYGGYPVPGGFFNNVPAGNYPTINPQFAGNYDPRIASGSTLSPQTAAGSMSGAAPIGGVPYGGFPGYADGYVGGVPLGAFIPPDRVVNSIRSGLIFGAVKDQEGRGLGGVKLRIITSSYTIDTLESALFSGYYGESMPFPGDGCSLIISHGEFTTLYPNFSVAGAKLYDFMLLPGSVTDEITDQPLVGVSIVAESLTDSFIKAQTVSNPNGFYQLFLPPGDYNLTAKLTSSVEIKPAFSKVTVTSTGHSQPVNFTLNLPVLAGKVFDDVEEEDKPLADAQIKISSIPPTPTPPLFNPIHTSSTGNFQVSLPLGTYTLEVTKAGYQPKIVTVNISGSLKDYRIELTKKEHNLPQNHAPVITSPRDGQVMVVKAGQDLCFSVKAEDPKDPYLYFTISGPESWPKIIREGGLKNTPKRYSYSTTMADLGEHSLEITVDDCDLSTSVYITVKVIYPIELKLAQGLNLISYPVASGSITAFDLLSLLGDANQVTTILRYDSTSKEYIQAGYTENGKKSGTNFFVNPQEGYIVYAKQPRTIDLEISNGNLVSFTLHLNQGTNLVGVPIVIGDNYSSYDLLLDLGRDSVGSLYHYKAKEGVYEFTYWIGDHPGGSDFPIRLGEGYFIEARTEKQISLPALR